MIIGSLGALGVLTRTNWADRLAVVQEPRVTALQNQSQNSPSLQDIDCMLLELSYMPRVDVTIDLVDSLLERRKELTSSMQKAAS